MTRNALMYSGTLSFISWGTRRVQSCMFQAFICYLFNQVEHLHNVLSRETFTGQPYILKYVYLENKQPNLCHDEGKFGQRNG